MSGAEWRFAEVGPEKLLKGGLAASEVFPSNLATLVRESLQNCRDQRIRNGGEGTASVAFRLREISGGALEDFLAEIDWAELRPHVEGSARDEFTEIGPKLQRGLQSLGSKEMLRVLAIEDTGTHGLTGEELKKGSNLFNLVRGELMSDPERKDAGGSYGLGKTVYWTFSELSTVIFVSIPDDTRNPLFLGRSDLASHPADDPEWYGPGFFGEVKDEGKGEFAVALRGEHALERSAAIGAARDPDETGASIVIVGFDDPAEQDEPDIETTCRRLVDQTTRWYWPALSDGTLKVEVTGEVNGEEIFRESPPTDVEDMPADVRPFVLAYKDLETAPELPAVEAEPGQTIRNQVSLKVPTKSDGSSGEVDGRAVLLARRMTDKELDQYESLPEDERPEGKGRVALLRGSGMVIAYQETGGDLDGHAVLVAGRAVPDATDSDKAVDEFVRACEPPAHDEWNGQTNKAKTEYATGGGKTTANSSLKKLWQEIKEKLTVEGQEPPASGETGPRELSRRFPLGGRDKNEEEVRGFILRIPSSETTDKYTIDGSFQMTSTNPGPKTDEWQFKVSLTIAEEGGGSGEPMRIEDLNLSTDGCRAEREADNCFAVTVPKTTRKVEFQVVSSKDPLNGVDLREVWPVLQAKAVDWS